MTERVALVTGGGRGIGRAICLGLAAQQRNIAVADIRVEDAQQTQQLINQAGGDKVIATMSRVVLMKRIGQPHEVASAVVYLASEEAGFVTGQTLSVSGGLTMV